MEWIRAGRGAAAAGARHLPGRAVDRARDGRRGAVQSGEGNRLVRPAVYGCRCQTIRCFKASPAKLSSTGTARRSSCRQAPNFSPRPSSAATRRSASATACTALQFHLEVTPDMIADWCAQDDNCGDMRELQSVIDPCHNSRAAWRNCLPRCLAVGPNWYIAPAKRLVSASEAMPY